MIHAKTQLLHSRVSHFNVGTGMRFIFYREAIPYASRIILPSRMTQQVEKKKQKNGTCIL